MTALIITLFLVTLILLFVEDRVVRAERKKLKHVVYVNGIRGKSTVTRLIDAGLRGGGLSVYCKTTGTVPMTIGTDNVERPLFRPGRANIKEQIKILRRAVKEKADVLVIECMAVDPVLQNVSQHRMVRADVGVITNVRLDHTAEMGPTLEEICDSLSNTIPRGGALFTADGNFVDQLRRNGERVGAQVFLAAPDERLPAFDFPENLALALAVCEHLGVSREKALAGMASFQPDPYALSLHTMPGGAVFINAMSANDPDSTQLIYRRMAARQDLQGRRLILLINNRPDRGYRTEHMVMVARGLTPDEIWLIGASRRAVERRLARVLPDVPVRSFKDGASVPLAEPKADTLIFGAGNIAGPGKDVLDRVREEGEVYVL